MGAAVLGMQKIDTVSEKVPVILTENDVELGKKAAQLIAEQIKKKSDLVLGLVTDSTPINMYKELASTWIDRGYRFHMISVYSTDDTVQETISWLGFGKYVIDGILNAATFSIRQKEVVTDYEIRKGGASDLHIITPLALELGSYLSRSPLFLQKETTDIQYYKRWVGGEGHHFWLAFDGKTSVGYIQIESGAEDVSSIVQDPESVSITGLYVSPSYRNKDIGKRLLEHAVNWTKENALRLCVDFESVNNLGREFWLKYFKPFSFSYYRYTL